MLSALAQRNMVPACAMQVSRANDADFGETVSFTPPQGCVCHFDEVLGISVPSTCTTCQTNADCPSGSVCANWGTATDKMYCERGQ